MMLDTNELMGRLKKVRLFLCDVDGILTDGTVLMTGEEEVKQFHVFDGLGIRLLREHAGLKVGWISARPSPATTRRAEELHVDFLYQDRAPKVTAIEGILERAGCTWAEVCYMGDDIVDLGALRRAGVAVSVPEALPEAMALAHYVTRKSGGRGAVREVVELILRAQEKWEPLVREYSA
jgi:3-deoxy-D-manno-octulosonate 8-phosphate phosphatase (KDO 8-P phosphatase)